MKYDDEIDCQICDSVDSIFRFVGKMLDRFFVWLETQFFIAVYLSDKYTRTENWNAQLQNIYNYGFPFSAFVLTAVRVFGNLCFIAVGCVYVLSACVIGGCLQLFSGIINGDFSRMMRKNPLWIKLLNLWK